MNKQLSKTDAKVWYVEYIQPERTKLIYVENQMISGVEWEEYLEEVRLAKEEIQKFETPKKSNKVTINQPYKFKNFRKLSPELRSRIWFFCPLQTGTRGIAVCKKAVSKYQYSHHIFY
jgi:hypothetical protein